jgi:exodeoxyribonuclease V alpha subunit
VSGPEPEHENSRSGYSAAVSVTITGQVERITYENEQTGFRVVRLGRVEGQGARAASAVVVGSFQAVGPGMRLRVTGEYVVDTRHGEQFRASVVVPIEPTTLPGIERYLGSGLIPGVGPALAKRIVKTFELETFDVLDREPQRLSEVPGLGEKRVREIRQSWTAQRALSGVLVLLASHGASHALALRIWKHYGDRAASIVQKSPYRLALDVRGVGFKTADKLAASLGISKDHPERCQAGVIHVLGELAESGHVFAERQQLVDGVATMLEVGSDHVQSAIDGLFASERVMIDGDAVYLARLYRAECEVARGVRRLLCERAPKSLAVAPALARFEKLRRIELAPSQRSAVETAARERCAIITGGPGVGKTTIVRAVLAVLESEGLGVRLAAPTGRAAKRLAEATGHEASTLHRLLEYDPRQGGFQRHSQNRLVADALIVDEASMIDIELAAALFAALPERIRLLFVGDADQLPSVGPGALLRDLIACGEVPSVRLSEIFRQAAASGIVRNAHRILRGELPVSDDPEDAKADFFVVRRRNPEEAAETVRELVTQRIPRRFGLDPKREVQVLTPMHRGAAGTLALNELLQSALNDVGAAIESRGQKLRSGDKVIQTRNDYDREVFNGDVGYVESVDPEERALAVRFEHGSVEYDESAIDALSLSYAISVHKSQGSEYPAMVMPLLTTHFVMLSRNLLYTAVTRARKLCVLVADPRALKLAVDDARREDRRTRLSERVRGQRATG